MLQKNKDIAKTDEAKPADQDTEAASHAVQLPDLRDRVVDSLLEKRIVTLEQVKEIQQKWQQGSKQTTLWRALTQHPKANRDAIFAEAARIYAFRQEEVNEHRPDLNFVKRILDSFSKEHRDLLIDLCLLPLEYKIDLQGVLKLLFVTHDPSRPETLRFVHDLNLEHWELCYAPESDIVLLLNELFPSSNKYFERLADENQPVSTRQSQKEFFPDVSRDISETLDERLKAIKLPEGRVIREGDYPPMQAVKMEDGTWVLIKRETPTTLWGRVKALLF